MDIGKISDYKCNIAFAVQMRQPQEQKILCSRQAMRLCLAY